MGKGAPLRWWENRQMGRHPRGRGLEVGALWKRFPVPATVERVWYADRLDVEGLAEHFTGHVKGVLPIDLVADATRLPVPPPPPPGRPPHPRLPHRLQHSRAPAVSAGGAAPLARGAGAGRRAPRARPRQALHLRPPPPALPRLRRARPRPRAGRAALREGRAKADGEGLQHPLPRLD